MKKILVSGLLVLIGAVAFGSPNVPVEVSVQKVLVPTHGFDDNDNVQIVVDGVLPNLCYTVSDTLVERKGQEVFARQFAFRRADPLCAEGAIVPEHLKAPVPYSVEVNLGRLSAGAYTVRFSNGGVGARNFQVDRAPSTDVDNFPYAPVQNVYMADSIRLGTPVEALLSGSTTSTCMELGDRFEMALVEDVVIVLPKMTLKTGMMCTFLIRPFERMVSVGVLPAGRYLMHVRSLNGRAVNRPFTVLGTP